MEICIPLEFLLLVSFGAVIVGLLILAGGSLIGRACERRAMEEEKKNPKYKRWLCGFAVEPECVTALKAANTTIMTPQECYRMLMEEDTEEARKCRTEMEIYLARMALLHPGKTYLIRTGKV